MDFESNNLRKIDLKRMITLECFESYVLQNTDREKNTVPNTQLVVHLNQCF